MIYYRAKAIPDETNVLDPLRHGVLVIRYSGEVPLLFQWSPEEGWAFEILNKIQPRGVESGASAYISDIWTGTTEW